MSPRLLLLACALLPALGAAQAKPPGHPTTSWAEVREQRKNWWSFRPIRDPQPPAVTDARARTDLDRFVAARLEAAGLALGRAADKATLLRRVHFVLVGLPPSPAAVDRFLADDSPAAFERVVDELLASERFGERWARHWMDWVRYADSHGSEGDPTLPNAWRYRDYLIRALNADVPYDRLVQEHLAGDLLPRPRIDRERGMNESALGTAQLRMVQHGFAPTDPLEEQVRFTDNQIDVISKAFLGLTVSCARCHDHKFDAISQKDFYALYGVMTSCRPAMKAVDEKARLRRHQVALRLLKQRIKRGLATAWRDSLDEFAERLTGCSKVVQSTTKTTRGRRKPRITPRHPLYALARTQDAPVDEFEDLWIDLVLEFEASRTRLRAQDARTRDAGFDLRDPAVFARWFGHGAYLDTVSRAGEFHVRHDGPRVIDGLLPAGVYSHRLSTKHNGVLVSPEFPFDHKRLFVRVMGDRNARVRYSMYGYPRRGTVYPIHNLRGGREHWVSWDISYWNGDRGYLEVVTAADAPTEADANAARSWFGISRVVVATAAEIKRNAGPKDEMAEVVAPLFDTAAAAAPTDVDELAETYTRAVRACIDAWLANEMTDAQARFLGAFVQEDLLPVKLEQLPQLRPLVAEYRRLEAELVVPTRAPGVLDAEPVDTPLMLRGNHKKPGDKVARRFLESVDVTPYAKRTPARLQLARDLVRKDNPFTARVAVNRVWHHVFGRGLVATPDNFGRLGQQPTHPDLLDHLASQLIASGWSLKKLIRSVVLSSTFRQDSRPTEQTRKADPTNRLLSRYPVRRLEAEAIRDAMLAVSGTLDRTMFGKPVGGRTPRRSVYVRVKRNDLDPFLTVFDAPSPHTTMGRRPTTNVPGQSLTLLNDPFVIRQAQALAGRVLGDADRSDAQRITQLFRLAFGRTPSATEVQRANTYLTALERQNETLLTEVARLDSAVATTERNLRTLLDPVRERLLAARRGDGNAKPGPEPIAAWEFDGDLEDSIGTLHGKAHGTARVAGGRLQLDGKGHVATRPLTKPLRAKTLEAWVQLRGLDQRSGGLMSVETLGGATFDSIVYAEKTPRRWLAGSNHFARTKALGGVDEGEAHERLVHVAITWDDKGAIRAFRDGQPYGKAYRSNGPVTFAAGKSVVLFGLRHSPPSGGRYLNGAIERARLYDRALSAEEIAASASGQPFVSNRELLGALTAAQRERHDRLQRQLAAARTERANLDVPEGFRNDPRQHWQDLAQSLFNLKEFVYLR